MDFDIEDVRRLRIEPGEVLLVKVPRSTRLEHVERLKAFFAKELPGVHVLVSTGVDYEVISPA